MILMTDVDQYHVDYEACTSCFGIFLDAGEFKDMRNFSMSDYLKGLFSRVRAKK